MGNQGHIHKPQLGPPSFPEPPPLGQDGLTLRPPGKIPATQAERHLTPAGTPGSNSLAPTPPTGSEQLPGEPSKVNSS